MSSPPWAAARLGFETFSTSVGLSLILGSLSLVVAGLVPVTGTLAALALAGWASLPRHRPQAHRPSRLWVALAFVPLLLGAVAFLAPEPNLAEVRGFCLALGLLPLWLVERPGRSRGAGGGVPT